MAQGSGEAESLPGNGLQEMKSGDKNGSSIHIPGHLLPIDERHGETGAKLLQKRGAE